VVLFFLTFNQATIVAVYGVAGLTQRILTLEVLAWFVAMGWRSFAARNQRRNAKAWVG